MWQLAGLVRAEAGGDGAGLDDVAAEGEVVVDGGAQSRVGEGLGPAAEALVGRDRDAVGLLTFTEGLEQQFGAARVQLQVAEFVELCLARHSSTYAEIATMPRRVADGIGACRKRSDASLSSQAFQEGEDLVRWLVATGSC